MAKTPLSLALEDKLGTFSGINEASLCLLRFATSKICVHVLAWKTTANRTRKQQQTRNTRRTFQKFNGLIHRPHLWEKEEKAEESFAVLERPTVYRIRFDSPCFADDAYAAWLSPRAFHRHHCCWPDINYCIESIISVSIILSKLWPSILRVRSSVSLQM